MIRLIAMLCVFGGRLDLQWVHFAHRQCSDNKCRWQKRPNKNENGRVAVEPVQHQSNGPGREDRPKAGAGSSETKYTAHVFGGKKIHGD